MWCHARTANDDSQVPAETVEIGHKHGDVYVALGCTRGHKGGEGISAHINSTDSPRQWWYCTFLCSSSAPLHGVVLVPQTFRQRPPFLHPSHATRKVLHMSGAFGMNKKYTVPLALQYAICPRQGHVHQAWMDVHTESASQSQQCRRNKTG
jgi:hypothetical protein